MQLNQGLYKYLATNLAKEELLPFWEIGRSVRRAIEIIDPAAAVTWQRRAVPLLLNGGDAAIRGASTRPVSP